MTVAVARRRAGLAHVVGVDERRELIVDEPVDVGGSDEGPSPTALLAISLASCTAITITMYTDRKGWDVDGLEVSVDFPGSPDRGEPATFTVDVKLPEGLDPEQRERIMVIAGKCPVHRILTGEVEIETREATAPG